MIAATVGMAFTALLFVVFGAFALADGRGGCHGDCGSCAVGECDREPDTPNHGGRHT